MKRIMAVYDVDPFYADRFAEFVNRKETVPFTAVAFTSIGRLKQFAEQQEVELLLAGDEVEAEELKDIRAGQVIRLGETNAAREGGRSVYKYQASDSVLREVMACYQSQEPVAAFFPAAGKRSQVIGVYSPVGRCGKTAFAFTLAQVLAREGRALFLTLEEFSGLSGLTGTEFQNGLSDLLYYYRQGLYSHLRLGSMVYSWGGSGLCAAGRVSRGSGAGDRGGDGRSGGEDRRRRGLWNGGRGSGELFLGRGDGARHLRRDLRAGEGGYDLRRQAGCLAPVSGAVRQGAAVAEDPDDQGA